MTQTCKCNRDNLSHRPTTLCWTSKAVLSCVNIVISSAGRDWRGTDVVTWTLLTGLRRQGHNVLVTCRPGSVLQERLRAAGIPHAAILGGLDLSPTVLLRCAIALRRFRADASDRDGEDEGRSLPWLGFDPDASIISLQYSLTYSKADSAAGVFFACMQAFKKSKDTLLESRLNSNPVVADRELPVAFLAFHRHMDYRTDIGSAVLDSVADQVLEELLKMRAVNLN